MLVPLGIIALGAWLAWGQVWHQAKADLVNTADIAAEYAAHLLDGHALQADRVDDLLRGLTDQQIREREGEIHTTLHDMAAAHQSVSSLCVADAEGHLLVSASVFPMPQDASIRDRSFLEAMHHATAPGLFVGQVHAGQSDDETILAVAGRRGAAARDTSASLGQDSPFQGLILVSLRFGELAVGLRRLIDEPHDVITLVRTDGKLLARSVSRDQPSSALAADVSLPPILAEGAQRAVTREHHLSDDIEYIAAFQRVKDWPVYISVARPRATVAARWGSLLAWQAGFGVPAVIALVGLVLFAFRSSRDAAEAHAALQVEAVGRIAGEALRESEERYRTLAEATHEGVAILDEQHIVEVNEAFWRMFGCGSREDAISRTYLDFVPSAVRQDTLDTMRHSRTEMHESIGRRIDGTCFPTESHSRPIQYRGRPLRVMLVRDLTRQKSIEAALREHEAGLREMQADLLHVSRLSLAGEMVSALAHELNQPLTAISSSSNGALRLLQAAVQDSSGRTKVPERALEAMTRASTQALRAGQIVARLREFVMKGEAEKQMEDIRELVKDAGTLALVGAKVRGVAVSIRIAPALPPVFVNRVQIQQVLINLIRNAVEAMSDEDGSGGTTYRELVVSVMLAGPETVTVSVADTGPGLAPEIASRLFQPFVTTKPDGMGVGLATSRSIVQAHGGQLWAEARPGGGTIFRFTLVTVSEMDMQSAHRI